MQSSNTPVLSSGGHIERLPGAALLGPGPFRLPTLGTDVLIVKHLFDHQVAGQNRRYVEMMALSGKSRRPAEERAKVFKALADPNRVAILDILAEEGTLCGTDLAERLGISVALLSHHLQILDGAGLIAKHREGQSKFCTMQCDQLRTATAEWLATGAAVPTPTDVDVANAASERVKAARSEETPSKAKSARKGQGTSAMGKGRGARAAKPAKRPAGE